MNKTTETFKNKLFFFEFQDTRMSYLHIPDSDYTILISRLHDRNTIYQSI